MPKKIFSSAPVWQNGLLIIRVLTAIMIISYGLELFKPAAMNDLVGFLTSIGFPLAKPMAYLAKITEFFGGILLGLGLFTRFVTIPLAITMVVVIYTMGGGDIFNSESATLFCLLFLSFFLAGPGRWSLDYLLFDRKRISVNKN
jgi:putative oxidoreductase